MERLKRKAAILDVLFVMCAVFIVVSLIMFSIPPLGYNILINTDNVVINDNGFNIKDDNITIDFSFEFDLNATIINYCFIQPIPPKSTNILTNINPGYNSRILNLSADSANLMLTFYVLIDIEYTPDLPYPDYFIEELRLEEGSVILDILYVFYK